MPINGDPARATEPLLEMAGITFGYRRSRPVLSEFSWTLPPGRTVLLGPNGAGKSTILGLAADALRPQAGGCRIGDVTARSQRRRYRTLVSYLPQRPTAARGLSVREQVAYAGWLKGMPKPAAWDAAPGCLEQVGLSEHAERRVTELSGGQLRRVGLAQALVHDAVILLLDEPTAGLDPAQRQRFRETLSGIGTVRSTVVSTHQVDDLDQVYDQVVVVEHGRIRFSGSVDAFRALAAPSAAGSVMERAYAAALDGTR